MAPGHKKVVRRAAVKTSESCRLIKHLGWDSIKFEQSVSYLLSDDKQALDIGSRKRSRVQLLNPLTLLSAFVIRPRKLGIEPIVKNPHRVLKVADMVGMP